MARPAAPIPPLEGRHQRERVGGHGHHAPGADLHDRVVVTEPGTDQHIGTPRAQA